MNILQTIRNKAQQALTGVGNFIDRDKSMSGIQLVPGGMQGGIDRVKQAVQTDPQQFNVFRQMGQGNLETGFKPLDLAGQGAGKALDLGTTFAAQAGQSIARSVPGLAQTARKVAAPLWGEDPNNIQDEFKVSELFPGSPKLQAGANFLMGKDDTIRTVQGTQDLLQNDYNIPAPLAMGLAVADPVSNFIPGSGAAKSGGKKLLQEGVEQVAKQGGKKLFQEGGEAVIKEVIEKGGKKLVAETGEAVAESGGKTALEEMLQTTGKTLGKLRKEIKNPKFPDQLDDILAQEKQVRGEYARIKKLVEQSAKKAPETVEQVLKGADEAVEGTVNALKKPQETFRRWVNTREGYANWRGGDIKRNPVFTAFDNEGLNAIKELQAGANPEKYAPIKQFTDELFEMERQAGLITPDKYRKNYLPQLWDNTPEEIQQVFSKSIGKDPSFTKNRLFEDYAAGIEAGLTPRFTQMSDLLESRFKTATRALADKEFVDSLVDAGNAVTLDKAPKGWVTAADLTKDGKPLAIPPELSKLIGNYTMEGSKLLEKTAEFVSETKQTLLSAGIPRTGLNFHTGVNIPVRAAMARNPFSAVIDSTIWNWHPQSARDYVQKTVPKEITDGLLKQGLTIARSAQDSGYGFKPEAGEGIIKGARSWMDKAFSEVAFDDILPAHKLKYGWEAYNRGIKQGLSEDEAFKVAAQTANELFGGINVAEIGRNKDFQNVMRTFFLAPDWLESNARIGLKTGSLLNPKNWGDKALAPYKRVALNALSMYGTMAMTNKALSGKFPWENGAGQEFNLATGQYDERGREIMIPVFGTAFDAFRIPHTVLSGLAQNKPEAITNVVKNRLSPIVGAGVAVASNSDYRGREITSPDKSPIENILGLAGQAATAVGVPSQLTNTLKFATGDSTPLEYGASLLEAPLRFRGGANTEAKRKEAEQLKEMGMSNKEIADVVSYKPDSGGGLFGWGKKELSAPPTKATSKKEQEAYHKAVDAALDSGSVPDEAALAYRFFKDKKASSKSIEERTDVYKEMNKVMDDEFYTDEQKEAILKASGADPKNVEYYTLASKDQDVRLQELMPQLDNMDSPQVVEFLMQGRRVVGGKQLVSNGMVDYLYENDYISEGEKKAIKALKYDEIQDKFYFSKSYTGGGSGSGKLTYKQAQALFKVDLPKFSQMKGVDALLQSYAQKSAQTDPNDDRLLQDILYKAPRKRNTRSQGLWF